MSSSTRTALLVALFTQVAAQTSHAQNGAKLSLAFAPDSKTLAVAGRNKSRDPSQDHRVTLWDLATKRVRNTIAVRGRPIEVAYSQDGNVIATCFDRVEGDASFGQVQLFDTRTGQERMILETGDQVGRISFSRTDSLLAVYTWRADTDWVIDLWDLDTKSIVRTLEVSNISAQCMVTTQSGTLCMGGGLTVDLWRLRDGAKVATDKSDELMTMGLAYWPRGNLIAQGATRVAVAGVPVRINEPLTGAVRLLDGSTGDLRQTIEITRGGVTAVAMSPDGSKLSVGSVPNLSRPGAGEVSIWDVETGGMYKILGTLSRPIFAIAFSPDGRFLAASDESGMIKLWDTTYWKAETLKPSDG